MTEMTNMKDTFASPLWPRPTELRYVIDPVAFAVSLVGGPCLVTLLTCWAVVPVFALAMGGPLYLAIGTPVLLWAYRLGDPSPGALALLALIAAVPACLLLTLFVEAKAEFFVGMLPFSMLFAPIWAVAFGLLYRWIRRDFYSHPIGKDVS